MLQKIHIIAISKHQNNELEMYTYNNGIVSLYSRNGIYGSHWNYEDKINQIAMMVDEGKLEWADIWIDDGQTITRQGENILINGNEVKLFSRLSKANFAQIGPVTSKIYNEYIRSSGKDTTGFKKIIKETFTEGFFTKKVSDIIEDIYDYPIEESSLNNLDRQIIVRVKIEGYSFIINFIKNILSSDLKVKCEYCEKFLSRVFLLESQNFIKVETDNIIII